MVRRVMERYPGKAANLEPGRRQPVSYTLTHSHLGKTLLVPGHYETPCGGCDTIKTTDRVYELVRDGVAQGRDVLYEGIMVQDDVRRLLELHQEYPVSVIELGTPLDVCLGSIQTRRNIRGDTRPLNPKNTTARARSVRNNCERLRSAGVRVPTLLREEAYLYCLRLLGIK